MSSRPWMPLYVGDYLAKTGHLSTLQHGAYLLLIMYYWSNGGLPTTDLELRTIARMTEGEWVNNCYTIAKFFTKDWHHNRIDKELYKVEKVSAGRRLAAAASVASRRRRFQ
jgi:uncharacterized protein YdaU (DUF1376 family)